MEQEHTMMKYAVLNTGRDHTAVLIKVKNDAPEVLGFAEYEAVAEGCLIDMGALAKHLNSIEEDVL
jgi:hypothetical protein